MLYKPVMYVTETKQNEKNEHAKYSQMVAISYSFVTFKLVVQKILALKACNQSSRIRNHTQEGNICNVGNE